MLHEQISHNKRVTLLVIATYFVLFLLIGLGIGQLVMDDKWMGLILAGVIGLVYIFFMMSESTAIVMGLNHAREIREEDAPKLYHIVQDMALVAKVPTPKVFIIDDEGLNAFATGPSPDRAAVAITTGLLNRLNREELEGVIAHEMSHIRNYDIRLQTISIALGAAIAVLVQISSRMMFWGGGRSRRDKDDDSSNGLDALFMILGVIAMIVGPLLASLMQLALSRNREYLADASAVELTRNPQGLISALQKLESSQPMSQADPSSAALYMVNPFGKEERDSLFSTHPSTANRIKRLSQM